MLREERIICGWFTTHSSRKRAGVTRAFFRTAREPADTTLNCRLVATAHNSIWSRCAASRLFAQHRATVDKTLKCFAVVTAQPPLWERRTASRLCPLHRGTADSITDCLAVSTLRSLRMEAAQQLLTFVPRPLWHSCGFRVLTLQIVLRSAQRSPPKGAAEELTGLANFKSLVPCSCLSGPLTGVISFLSRYLPEPQN